MNQPNDYFRYETENLAGDTRTVGDMIALAEGLHALKQDHEVKCTDLSFTDVDATGTQGDRYNMVLPGGIMGHIVAPLTGHALSQVCSKLDMPTRYFRRVPPHLGLSHFNHWVGKDDRTWFLRDIRDPDGGDGGERMVRAALSHLYAPIDNLRILQVVDKALNASGLVEYQLVRPYLTQDKVCMTMTFPTLDSLTHNNRIDIPDGERGNYGFGFRVSNSEIGDGSLHLSPFVQRNSCTNSINWIQGGFTQNHYGSKASAAFTAAAVAEHVGQALMLAPDIVNNIVEAEADEIPSIAAVLDKICEQHRLPKAIRDTALMGTEGKSNRMAVVNGLSFAAHKLPLKQEDKMNLENLAGATLAQGLFASVYRKNQQQELAEVA